MRDDPAVVVLVTRAREKDKAAWDEIVERYAPLVWSVCRRGYRLPEQDAEDVAQNVWVLLVEHLGTLREPAALPGWLVTTTRRECVRLLRAKQKRQSVEESERTVDPGAPSIEDGILVAERNAVVRAAFAQLPPECQELLSLLSHDPPLSYAEIGRRLGKSVGGLGPRRARCLDKLRHCPALAALIESGPTGVKEGEEHDQRMVER
jgi:RNA polymerase sigma factor (sigma-70 family)